MYFAHLPSLLRSIVWASCAGLTGSIAVPQTLAADYAVIVNQSNPVEALTRADLIRLFRAENQYWDGSLGRVQVLLPKSGSKEKEVLLREIYGMTEDELKRYWTELVFRNKLSEPPRVLPSITVALSVLARSKGAIAIVDVGTLEPGTPAKILAIDGKKPGSEGYLLHDREKKVGKVEAEALEAETSDSSAVPSGARAIPAAATDDSPQDKELEQRVKDLEQKLGELQYGAGENVDEGIGFDLGPKFHLRGFSDITFQTARTDPDGGSSDSSDFFALGGLDLLITSQLAERLSFLNETVFETGSDGETVTDVERLILKYDFGNAFNVQAGRFHTTLGYWNNAFHHGQWTQTSVGRPQIVTFEDDNGVLPVHTIGMALKAEQQTGIASLDYTLEIGNGRGPTPDPPQVASDENDSKAVNFALGVRPNGAPGFSFGANVMLDDIPKNTDVTAGPLHESTSEQIIGVFAAYDRGDWGLIAEAYDIGHDEDGGSDADSDGGLIQLSRKFGIWTPYVRFDWTNIDDADTFYVSDDDQTTIAAGVRWDVDTWCALKLQGSHTDVDAVAGSPDMDVDDLVFQAAFAF